MILASKGKSPLAHRGPLLETAERYFLRKGDLGVTALDRVLLAVW